MAKTLSPLVLCRIIDGAAAKEATLMGRNLSVAWIDFKKAFDMVPHPWVRDMLRAVRAPRLVRRTIKRLMKMWRTNVELCGGDKTIRIPVTFRRGLYQGDSLSPLLFCLCVAPLSAMLNSGGGFGSDFQEMPLTHLSFVDDFKLYEESQDELEATVAATESLSRALGMAFGVQKCGVAHMVAGRVRERGGVELVNGAEVKEMMRDESYRYLGLEQLFGARDKQVREKVVAE